MMSNTNFNNDKRFQFAVFIRCGRNLENKKFIGSNAPYVEVTINNETKKTSSLSDLSNPCWNESLRFELKDNNNLPTFIKFEVKDDRTLLPSLLLGEYTFIINPEKIAKYRSEPEIAPFCTLFDGPINLKDCEKGALDVQILFECNNINWLNNNKEQGTELMTKNEMPLDQQGQFQGQGQFGGSHQVKYEEVNRNDFEKLPDIALQKNEVVDDRKDEMKYDKKEAYPEIHVLPTLHVKEKPIITEKEIEYTKPVEVKETIIHKEQPIIIEQPIIKEKNEHYREAPQHIKSQETIVNEHVHEQDVGNLDQEALKDLRKQRQQEFSDTTPIIQHEKEHIQLDKDIREMPQQVREKQVLYQQPVEIEKTNIEKVKPKVYEDITVEKEHVQQKLAPEVHIEDAKTVQQGDEFYSKETASNLKMAPVVDSDVNRAAIDRRE